MFEDLASQVHLATQGVVMAWRVIWKTFFFFFWKYHEVPSGYWPFSFLHMVLAGLFLSSTGKVSTSTDTKTLAKRLVMVAALSSACLRPRPSGVQAFLLAGEQMPCVHRVQRFPPYFTVLLVHLIHLETLLACGLDWPGIPSVEDGLIQWSSCLSLLSRWDCRCAPLCQDLLSPYERLSFRPVASAIFYLHSRLSEDNSDNKRTDGQTVSTVIIIIGSYLSTTVIKYYYQGNL